MPPVVPVSALAAIPKSKCPLLFYWLKSESTPRHDEHNKRRTGGTRPLLWLDGAWLA